MRNHLTAREMNLIKNHLEHERLLVQKYKYYSEIAQTDAVQELCQKVSYKHENHYNRLLDYLQENTEQEVSK